MNCTEDRCRVFSPNGGAVNGRVMPSRNGGSGAARLHIMTIPGSGTSAPDLMLTYYAVNFDVCVDINRKMGVADDILYNIGFPTNSTNLLYYNSPYPTGAFPASTSTFNVPQVAGIKGTFCSCSSADQASCTGTFDPMLHHIVVTR